MAMSTALQSLTATQLPGLSSGHLHRQPRAGFSTRIRCNAEGQSSPSSGSSSSIPPQTPPPKAPTPKESTNFSDVLAFSGPGPERINGRLAMIGFVAALGAELAQGDGVLGQLMNGGLPWFVGTSVLFTVASLIPLFKGVSAQSKSSGLMTSDAELWNGRFAMLGLVALVFTEYLKGGALV